MYLSYQFPKAQEIYHLRIWIVVIHNDPNDNHSIRATFKALKILWKKRYCICMNIWMDDFNSSVCLQVFVRGEVSPYFTT